MERALIADAKRDSNHFGELYKHYYPVILRFVEGRLKLREVSEDLTGQAFEKALKNLKSFEWENENSFSAWLFQIAKRLLIDYFRSQSRRNHLSTDSDIDPAATDKSAQEEAEEDWQRQTLGEMLLTLPDRERKVIYMKFYNGYTNRLIAELLQISESNVGTIIHRVVERLKSQGN